MAYGSFECCEGEPVQPGRVYKSFRIMTPPSSSSHIFRLALIWILGAALHAAESDRVFTVRGVVQELYKDGTISIQHEEIPGFMPAMTMPFYVDAADVEDLAKGDVVVFEFRVGAKSRATQFRKVGRVTPPQVDARAPEGLFRRLREGDAVPPFRLLDHDGRALPQADLRGRNTIVTFIFTRCPVPEFCPLIGTKFQALQAALAQDEAGAERTRLLSISIDPEHDRPAVLRRYGESLSADFRRWTFATGSAEEIAWLTRLFAVRTERNAAALDHSLATALIGPDGKVVEIWRGNAWKPEQILKTLKAQTSHGP